MLNVGSIMASLSLNISNFVKGFANAQKAVNKFGNSLNKSLEHNRRQLNNLNKGIEETKKNFRNMDRIVSGILVSQAFYRGIQSIEGATKAIVGFQNEMSRAQIAMEYFLGSEERAKGFIVTMKDFAATTAFSTEQALELSKRLMGAGYAAENIRPVMTILNDAANATGTTKDEMNRIVLALTQMRTQGRLMATEIRQFANANIPIYQVLREELGLTARQMENIGDLNISGETAAAAILKGLERRYAGAADKVAQTLGGMWDSIRDDSLIVSEGLFQKPYKSLENFVRRIRDTMETARHALTKGGVGGLLETLLPPEMHTSIRSIVASISRMTKSFIELAKAVGLVFKDMSKVFIGLLGNTLPIISAVVSNVMKLAASVLTASPAVRILAGALMSLIVANVAGKALMFLWSVTRMGAISAAVAKAVLLLQRAIQLLFLTLARNPVTGIVMLVAGALMYLAFSSKTVSGWLDRVTKQIANLAGLNLGNVLQPEDNTSVDEWTEQFNKQLKEMEDNLKDVGKNADAAGKKVKDKFVASFDELYQVPEVLDDMNDGLDMPSLDFADMPALPSLNPNDILTPPEDDGNPPWLIPGRSDRQRNNRPPVDPGPTTSAVQKIRETLSELGIDVKKSAETFANAFASSGVVVAAWAIEAGEALESFRQRMGLNFGTTAHAATETTGQWTSETKEQIRDWSSETKGQIEGTTEQTGRTLTDWQEETNRGFGGWGRLAVAHTVAAGQGIKAAIDWFTNTGFQAIDNWITSTSAGFINWGMNTLTELGNWALNGALAVDNWVTNTSLAFLTWSTNTATSFGNWTTNTYLSFQSWITNTSVSFGNWATGVALSFDTWVDNTTTAVTTWSVNTALAFGSWVETNAVDFANWSTNTLATFSAWANNSATNFGTWIVNTSTGFTSWVNSTASTVGSWAVSTSGQFANWVNNVGTNFATWANNATNSVSTWYKNTSSAFATWINSTSSSAASWVSNVSTSFATWANNANQTFNSWASSSWSTFGNFLSGTASNTVSWANSVTSSIVSWASNAWSTIKNLASAVGAEVSGWFSAADKAISNTYSGMSNWVSNNKEWLVPVAAGAIVVGAAAATAMTGGAAAPALAAALVAAPVSIAAARPSIPAANYEIGGIVSREQLAYVAERNRREAIIPMENSSHMKPFSSAVASDLFEMMQSAGFGGGSYQETQPDTRPILYVANLIADERSLKELERKLEIYRTSEQGRRGL